MNQSLVLTLLGPDRPGIVETVSRTISEHGGNWEQSRMSKLAGHFAGLARITCPSDRVGALEQALRDLGDPTLAINLISCEEKDDDSASNRLELDVVGNDRPGIVAGVTRMLRENQANILEIETKLRPAPESGIPIFHTLATISLPTSANPSALIEALETLSPDLQVSLT